MALLGEFSTQKKGRVGPHKTKGDGFAGLFCEDRKQEFKVAVPKKKVSKSRGAMRASHKALKTRQLFTCPQCDARNRPHTVCLNCGFYRGKVAIKVHEEDF